MDHLSIEQRHKNMSHVHSKNTKIEVKVRKALFAAGFRYRKNVKDLPGTPDIVLSRYKTVIFVNGCFWHQHQNCKKSKIPSTNTNWWRHKLRSNVVNDRFNKEKLESMGWTVVTIWQCQLEHNFDEVINNLIKLLKRKKFVQR